SNDAEATECSCGRRAARLRAATGSHEPILSRLQNFQGPDVRSNDQWSYRGPGAAAFITARRAAVAHLLADGRSEIRTRLHSRRRRSSWIRRQQQAAGRRKSFEL